MFDPLDPMAGRLECMHPVRGADGHKNGRLTYLEHPVAVDKGHFLDVKGFERLLSQFLKSLLG